MAKRDGFISRVVEEDGVGFICTEDFRTDRINFKIKNNIIIS